jgi:molybdopterin-binding protein
LLRHPQDIEILPASDRAGAEALVERVVSSSVEVQVDLKLNDGRDVSIQITHEDAEQLELQEGQIVGVRLRAQDATPS